MPEPSPIAIEARDVHKAFRLPVERRTTLKERMVHPGSWFQTESMTLKALEGISFDVARGEFFGVIGRNGCGKSTLLKLLASIYSVDRGTVRIAGRLSPFIELGVGFNPEVNAYDNVVMNGVMMGLTTDEAKKRYEEVIDYAELWDYTELKLKNYSSGMHVRLAFSLMLQVDADILLVDEVIAVGDAAFQKKCTASLREIQRGGTTVVLVTHDMGAIQRFCDRAMLIEDGRIEYVGEPKAAAERYLEILLGGDKEVKRIAVLTEAPQARVTDIWLADAAGDRVRTLTMGEPVTVNLTLRADEDVDYLGLSLDVLQDMTRSRIASLNVTDQAKVTPMSAGEEVTIGVQITHPLPPGGYLFDYTLLGQGPDGVTEIDRSAEPTTLDVLGADEGAGLLSLDHRIAVDSRRDTGAPS